MNDNIITVSEARKNGVNLDNVDYCRQLRHIAACDRVCLDENIHRINPYNKHLFSYIEYCGLDPLDYIKKYISNLQPYMLQHLPSQEKTDTMICMLDNAYRISLYIKADKYKGHELIISFHENINKRGFAKENNTIKNFSALQSEIVPVFGEPTGARIEGSPREEIKLFIQRGMLVLPVLVMAQKCQNNIYLVERGTIENLIVDQCNQYLRDLYSSNVELEALDKVEIFSVLQQISFTSYGNSIFSNLTLLIDNLELQRGIPSIMAADFALTTYLEHLYLTDEQADELIGLLHDKYNVSSTNIQPLLNRIEDNLLAIAFQTKSIIDSQAESKDALIQEHNKLVSSDDEINNIQNISKRPRGL